MAVSTTDPSANANEYIAQSAKVLGKGKDRPAVFTAIYAGKKQVKTISELIKATGLTRMRVLQEGGKLAAHSIVDQEKVDGETAYKKRPFIQHNKKRILSLAANPQELKSYPTKWSSAQQGRETVNLRLGRERAKIRQITLDDISSFSEATSVSAGGNLPKEISEEEFKTGVKHIIGEDGTFRDWGGEINDLFTTRLRICGRRRPAAFGFKGPATTGKLTPGKMGKNGDQIQRLFESPAEAFIVQYRAQIDQSVVKQMELLATAKSVFVGKEILYGVIDGQDSNRIYEGYKDRF